MTDKPIRIGFIGLNPGVHWAATAHIPALTTFPNEYEVVGVANTSLASARKAADAFKLPHAFENAQTLVNSPEVDLVVVTVKVPHHHELVTAALGAGKHVYCEWPLGNGLAEARELADLAEAAGVVAAVGTQMRVAPEIEHLRQLIADGYVGEVLSTTLVGSGGPWGGVTDAGETIPMTSHDQVLVHGALENGAALSIHYRGCKQRSMVFIAWQQTRRHRTSNALQRAPLLV